MGSASKSNEGQAKLVQEVISALLATKGDDSSRNLEITVLSPYSKQVLHLKNSLRPPTPCYTIDSFQGRESDIIIFSTVRCNATGEIGFVEDKRRLNVMWTRAKLAVIIIGDRRTMTETSGLWRRAIESCTEVKLASEEQEK
jgi:superfamily I DNA and/or RNA helicase